MKTKLVLSTLAVAAVATPLTYQHVQLNRLQTENRNLQAQITQAVHPPGGEAQQKQRAAEADELLRLRAEHQELLRLRGEAGRLRAETARLAQLEAELARLRARPAPVDAQGGGASADSDQPTEEEKFAQAVAIPKLNAIKHWGLALILCAEERDDTLPATLAEARKFLNKGAGELESPPILDEDAIELTYAGALRMTDIKNPSATILARERQPWVGVSGQLARTYVFADGHSEIHSAANLTELQAWERERGVANP